eukprot:764969-Hanusia_phi.AAC.1
MKLLKEFSCFLHSLFSISVVSDVAFSRKNGLDMRVNSIFFVPFVTFSIGCPQKLILVTPNNVLYNRICLDGCDPLHFHVNCKGTKLDFYTHEDYRPLSFFEELTGYKIRDSLNNTAMDVDELEIVKKKVKKELQKWYNNPYHKDKTNFPHEKNLLMQELNTIAENNRRTLPMSLPDTDSSYYSNPYPCPPVLPSHLKESLGAEKEDVGQESLDSCLFQIMGSRRSLKRRRMDARAPPSSPVKPRSTLKRFKVIKTISARRYSSVDDTESDEDMIEIEASDKPFTSN